MMPKLLRDPDLETVHENLLTCFKKKVWVCISVSYVGVGIFCQHQKPRSGPGGVLAGKKVMMVGSPSGYILAAPPPGPQPGWEQLDAPPPGSAAKKMVVDGWTKPPEFKEDP